MQPVMLKNGAEELDVAVKATFHVLKQMFTGGDLKEMLAVFDLVSICKGQGASVSPETVRFLIDRSLLQPNGTPHDTIRNIVLSSFEGESFEMRMVSPIAA